MYLNLFIYKWDININEHLHVNMHEIIAEANFHLQSHWQVGVNRKKKQQSDEY